MKTETAVLLIVALAVVGGVAYVATRDKTQPAAAPAAAEKPMASNTLAKPPGTSGLNAAIPSSVRGIVTPLLSMLPFSPFGGGNLPF